ncbi:MAG TPA: aldehyde dehydrogenase family protein [Candidatus Dojkabacteria bacterium]|nr:aldehyde dehydrogenase family protein [Candidatus Dojkabacteria bacterium]
MLKLISINPSNYKKLGEVPVTRTKEIKDKVTKAHKAKEGWKNLGVAKRIELLQEIFAEFKKNKERFAMQEAQEMGMPIGEALLDFDATLDYANWYFENAEKYLAPETTFENTSEIHRVHYEPLGVAAVIVPWNFPFANFVWAALQNLICGNAVVFKHSEEVPLCTQLIEKIMLGGRLPEGVFSVGYGAGDVGRQLVNQDINLIAFTGSTKVGRQLYQLAGKKFIKAVMELGGSAPGIIFADADLELATQSVCLYRLLNQGQCCDGLKRLIVHDSVLEEIIEKLSIIFRNKKVGDATDKSTDTGPLVAKRQLELLVSQVEDAKTKGVKIVTGGKSLEKKLGGVYYQPTIITNVKKDMRIWKEEVFGPVLPIVSFKSDEEAVQLANETAYGLGSYVYTNDRRRADKIAKSLQTGMVGINGTNYIMPFNPFGGYKASGFGREHGKYGFHELTQIKIIAKNK